MSNTKRKSATEYKKRRRDGIETALPRYEKDRSRSGRSAEGRADKWINKPRREEEDE